MKLIIEIEDVRDLEAWEKAIESALQAMRPLYDLYTRSAERRAVILDQLRAQGRFVRRVQRLLHDMLVHLSRDPDKEREEQEGKRIPEFIFWKMSGADLRLAVEYYSMPKPSKQGLAADLARKNDDMRKIGADLFKLYGPRGTTSALTMEKQIKRVLKREECQTIAKFTPEQMETARELAERKCYSKFRGEDDGRLIARKYEKAAAALKLEGRPKRGR
jgi:hypothetical protein